MINALNTAATGMAAQAKQVEVISNNIANADTVGFKKGRAEFQDLFYQNTKDPGSATSATTQSPTGIQVGLGSQLSAVSRDHSQGSFRQTGRNLDIAVGGDGFLAFQKGDGQMAYSRDGSLQLSPEGRLVNAQGFALANDITIPAGTQGIQISTDGRVQVRSGTGEVTDVGTIQLTNFANPSGLQAVGGNLLIETAASGAPTPGNPTEPGFGAIQQQFLEASNVQPMNEMTDMIRAQRVYELNSKVITTSDQMMGMLNQVR
jgi:flagellar basal-body rod protein FlgG